MRKLLAPALALAAALVVTVGAAAENGRSDDDSKKVLTFAVIGDTPYGPAQEALFPSLVEDIDADRDVQLALHLGDIKTGSSLCTDDYFAQIKSSSTPSTTRSSTRPATTSGRTAIAPPRAGTTRSSG